jgi:hypothetical protein
MLTAQTLAEQRDHLL